jgi:hypothetical protein
MIQPGEIFNALVVEVIFVHQLPVKVNGLVRRKNYWGAKFHHPVIQESFDDNFSTNTIDVTYGDAYNRFVGLRVTHAFASNGLAKIMLSPESVIFAGHNVHTQEITRPAFSD